MAKETNSFSNQMGRIGAAAKKIVAPAKAAVERGAAERKARTAPAPVAAKPTPKATARPEWNASAKSMLDGKRTSGATQTAKMAPMSKAAKPASASGMKDTKAGAYPVYKKDSASAGGFRTAFAEASSAGKKTFDWNGRSYSTKKA